MLSCFDSLKNTFHHSFNCCIIICQNLSVTEGSLPFSLVDFFNCFKLFIVFLDSFSLYKDIRYACHLPVARSLMENICPRSQKLPEVVGRGLFVRSRTSIFLDTERQKAKSV